MITQRQCAREWVTSFGGNQYELFLLERLLAATRNPGLENDGSVDEATWIAFREVVEAERAAFTARQRFLAVADGGIVAPRAPKERL